MHGGSTPGYSIDAPVLVPENGASERDEATEVDCVHWLRPFLALDHIDVPHWFVETEGGAK